eukprot:scaffold606_cov375-Pinguiococcus_pyrenoidosus.AAC.2
MAVKFRMLSRIARINAVAQPANTRNAGPSRPLDATLSREALGCCVPPTLPSPSIPIRRGQAGTPTLRSAARRPCRAARMHTACTWSSHACGRCSRPSSVLTSRSSAWQAALRC